MPDVEVTVDGAGVDRGHARRDDPDDAVHEVLREVDEREALDVGALDEDLVQQRHRPGGRSVGEVMLRVRAVRAYP